MKEMGLASLLLLLAVLPTLSSAQHQQQQWSWTAALPRPTESDSVDVVALDCHVLLSSSSPSNDSALIAISVDHSRPAVSLSDCAFVNKRIVFRVRSSTPGSGGRSVRMILLRNIECVNSSIVIVNDAASTLATALPSDDPVLRALENTTLIVEGFNVHSRWDTPDGHQLLSVHLPRGSCVYRVHMVLTSSTVTTTQPSLNLTSLADGYALSVLSLIGVHRVTQGSIALLMENVTVVSERQLLKNELVSMVVGSVLVGDPGLDMNHSTLRIQLVNVRAALNGTAGALGSVISEAKQIFSYTIIFRNSTVFIGGYDVAGTVVMVNDYETYDVGVAALLGIALRGINEAELTLKEESSVVISIQNIDGILRGVSSSVLGGVSIGSLRHGYTGGSSLCNIQLLNRSCVSLLSLRINGTVMTTGPGAPSVACGVGAGSFANNAGNTESSIQVSNESSIVVSSEDCNTTVSTKSHGSPSVMSGVGSSSNSNTGTSASNIHVSDQSRVVVSTGELNATLENQGVASPAVLSGIVSGSVGKGVSNSIIQIASGSSVVISTQQINATVTTSARGSASVLSGLGSTGSAQSSSSKSGVYVLNSSAVSVSLHKYNVTVIALLDSCSVVAGLGAVNYGAFALPFATSLPMIGTDVAIVVGEGQATATSVVSHAIVASYSLMPTQSQQPLPLRRVSIYTSQARITCVSGVACVIGATSSQFAATTRLVFCASFFQTIFKPTTVSPQLLYSLTGGPPQTTDPTIDTNSNHNSSLLFMTQFTMHSPWPCLTKFETPPTTMMMFGVGIRCSALGTITQRPGMIVSGSNGTVKLSNNGTTVWNGITVDVLNRTAKNGYWDGVELVSINDEASACPAAPSPLPSYPPPCNGIVSAAAAAAAGCLDLRCQPPVFYLPDLTTLSPSSFSPTSFMNTSLPPTSDAAASSSTPPPSSFISSFSPFATSFEPTETNAPIVTSSTITPATTTTAIELSSMAPSPSIKEFTKSRTQTATAATVSSNSRPISSVTQVMETYMSTASAKAFVATGSVSSGVSAAGGSPYMSTQVAKVNSITRSTACDVEEEQLSPALYEHPIQFSIGDSEYSLLSGAVVGSTGLFCFPCVALLVIYFAFGAEPDALERPVFGLKVFAALTSIALSYFGPNIVSGATIVGVHTEEVGLPRVLPLGCALVTLGLTMVIAWMSVVGGHFNRNVKVIEVGATSPLAVPPHDDNANQTLALTAAASQDNTTSATATSCTDETAGAGKIEFQPTSESCAGFVEALGPFFDAGRNGAMIVRMHYFVDLGIAMVGSMVSSLMLGEPYCLLPGVAVLILAVLNVAYLLIVRPYRTKMDTAFSTGCALLQCALALSGLLADQVSSSLQPLFVAGLLMQVSAFYVQTSVSMIWQLYLRKRRQDKRVEARRRSEEEERKKAEQLQQMTTRTENIKPDQETLLLSVPAAMLGNMSSNPLLEQQQQARSRNNSGRLQPRNVEDDDKTCPPRMEQHQQEALNVPLLHLRRQSRQ